MTDIEPLLQARPGSPLGVLLQVAADEQPSPRLPSKILVGLGVGAAATGFSVAASGAALVAPPTAGGGTLAAQTAGVLLAKWIAVGVVGGVVAAAGLQTATSTTAPAAPGSLSSPPAPVQVQAQKLAAPVPVAAPDEPLPVPDVAPAPSATLARAPQAPSAPSSTSPAPVREEVRRIDAARAALAAGNAQQALNELSAYDRIAVSGMLDREARVLRIEALVKSGDWQRARQLAAAYSTAFPNDAHARRLRSLISAGEGGSIEPRGDMNSAERFE
jgi:hypothetical protein